MRQAKGEEGVGGKLLTANDSTTNCRKGWHFFGDMCYKAEGKDNEEKLSWHNASKKCSTFGGQLATIHSKELQEFIVTFLLLQVKANTWIGLHDQVNETVYEWEDNSTVDFTYWRPGEPSSTYNKGGQEDCVEMIFVFDYNVSGLWNDIRCHYEMPYVCQMNADSNNERAVDLRFCPDGGWSFGTSCLYILSSMKSWMEAEKQCSVDYQGHLVAVTDFTVRVFLDYVLKNNTEKALWIGMKFEKELFPKWSSKWLMGYTVWETEPDPQELTEGNCVVRLQNGLWKIVPCTSKFGFICEKSTGSATPPVLKPPEIEGSTCPQNSADWKDLGGENCYLFEITTYVSWNDANFDCMRRGGSLISFHSPEEVEVIRQFIKYTRWGVYMGLYRNDYNGFSWADGSEFDFQFWSVNEPNDRKELCTEISEVTLNWNDIGCRKQKSYICSAKKVPPKKEVLCPVDEHPMEPKDWSGYSCPRYTVDVKNPELENCYYFEFTNYVSWNEANFLCMRKGGSLASIHSQKEVDALREVVLKRSSTPLHIGLFRNKYDNSYSWADGSDLDFEAWDLISTSGSDTFCTDLFPLSMEWSEISCSKKRGFICSFKKVFPNGTVPEKRVPCINPPTKQVPTTSQPGDTASRKEAPWLSGLCTSAVVLLIILILLVIALILIQVSRLRPWIRRRRHSSLTHLQPLS